KHGALWMATRTGICKFDGRQFINYDSHQRFIGTDITTLCPDDNGNIWIGTRSRGLVKFDGKTFSAYPRIPGWKGSNITSITRDRNRTIWFTSFGDGFGQYID